MPNVVSDRFLQGRALTASDASFALLASDGLGYNAAFVTGAMIRVDDEVRSTLNPKPCTSNDEINPVRAWAVAQKHHPRP